MPRTGGVYSPPAGTKGVSNTTIQSVPYNAFVDDLTADANAARPVTAGGTGATTASGARTNLGAQTANAALTSISGLTTSADKMIYTTAADAYATTALTPFARTILDDTTAGAVLTTLGVSAFMQTVLDDADAATARATLGANSASNLTTGTLPDARLSGAYSGITTLSQTGLHTITVAGEALRINGPLATDDPYISFYAGGVRTGYIQHTDGTGQTNGFRFFNELTNDFLFLHNTNSVNALKFWDDSVQVAQTVWHSGNLGIDDLNGVPNSRSVIAGNGMAGGGQLTADRTLTLGTPGSITNSTTNSVTTTSHTHALGFTAAEVYTGSSSTLTDYPIGTVLLVRGDSVVKNSTATVRNENTSEYYNRGSGTALSGTWRSRGIADDAAGSTSAIIYQRTA